MSSHTAAKNLLLRFFEGSRISLPLSHPSPQHIVYLFHILYYKEADISVQKIHIKSVFRSSQSVKSRYEAEHAKIRLKDILNESCGEHKDV